MAWCLDTGHIGNVERGERGERREGGDEVTVRVNVRVMRDVEKFGMGTIVAMVGRPRMRNWRSAQSSPR